jgi:hypothetical protein
VSLSLWTEDKIFSFSSDVKIVKFIRVSECLLFPKVGGVMKIYEPRKKKLLNLLCS